VAQDEQAPALWIGTSGTTGASKGVVHAQRVACQPHAFASGVLGLTASDRLYASSKLFFAYALGNSLLAGLRAGATVILDRQWPEPERVLAMVRTHRPTIVFCVPTLYSRMLQTGVAGQLAGQGVRHFVSAGESLPAAVRGAWREATGLGIVSGYGTSETCLIRPGLLAGPHPLRLRQRPIRRCRSARLHSHGRLGRESGEPMTFRMAGIARATCSCAARTAGWSTPGATTTCSRSAGAGSARCGSSRRSVMPPARA
jgi:acyl-coenzyme A synthetase/AMP-(fatty) acid ligase